MISKVLKAFRIIIKKAIARGASDRLARRSWFAPKRIVLLGGLCVCGNSLPLSPLCGECGGAARKTVNGTHNTNAQPQARSRNSNTRRSSSSVCLPLVLIPWRFVNRLPLVWAIPAEPRDLVAAPLLQRRPANALGVDGARSDWLCVDAPSEEHAPPFVQAHLSVRQVGDALVRPCALRHGRGSRPRARGKIGRVDKLCA